MDTEIILLSILFFPNIAKEANIKEYTNLDPVSQNISDLGLKAILQYHKGAATDMRYFARGKFSRSLVYKKNFSLMRQVVFKLGYVFCQER